MGDYHLLIENKHSSRRNEQLLLASFFSQPLFYDLTLSNQLNFGLVDGIKENFDFSMLLVDPQCC